MADGGRSRCAFEEISEKGRQTFGRSNSEPGLSEEVTGKESPWETSLL